MSVPPPKKPNASSLISLIFELSFLVFLSVLLFILSGKWLDLQIGTYPLFTLLGVLLALALTSVFGYRKFKKHFNGNENGEP